MTYHGSSQPRVINNLEHLSKMANNNKNKKPAVEAPVVDKKPAAEAAVETPATVQMPNTGMPSGLSQDAKVAYMTGLQHRKDEMLKNGGENANHYVALTLMEDATILDIAVTEAVVRKNPMGLIFSTNEKNWNMLEMLAKDMGVRFKYSGVDEKKLTVGGDMKQDIINAVKGKGERVYIVINYTLLFSTKKILKELEEEL